MFEEMARLRNVEVTVGATSVEMMDDEEEEVEYG